MAPLADRELSPQVAGRGLVERQPHSYFSVLFSAGLGALLALDVKSILIPPCIFH
jgi:hypothetical protein